VIGAHGVTGEPVHKRATKVVKAELERVAAIIRAWDLILIQETVKWWNALVKLLNRSALTSKNKI